MSQQEIIDALKVLKNASIREIAEHQKINIGTARINIRRLLHSKEVKLTHYKFRTQYYELLGEN
jgi:predicted transcriptional regulator